MPHPLYPVFLDLAGKPVLVVGAGAVAARKLAGLLECGARVTVVAPEVSDGVRRLAAGIELRERPYRAGDAEGMFLAFACGPAEVNHAVGADCRAAGVACCAAHDAGEAGFHVPAVIRNGDVTVAVGTGGRAPGLTRFLKRRLSRALGEGVGALARVLGDWRAELKASAGRGSPGRLADLPYARLLEELERFGPERARETLERWAREAGAAPGGSAPAPPVTLAGAGPGHPKLITMLTWEAIQGAEVIVHDRLIPEEVLAAAAADCLLVPVGKRGHAEGASARQEEIDALLVSHAQAGRRVLRLKGGDPFVFGRGWEEIEALRRAGLDWVVLPGLSSATAVPGWAGIPLTHRGLARSFAVMSGMASSGTNLDIPRADTVVVLMGLQRASEIMAAFMRQGWDPATPAAAVQAGTTPGQRMCLSTVGRIADDTARLGFSSPALLVVGAVAGLAGGPSAAPAAD